MSAGLALLCLAGRHVAEISVLDYMCGIETQSFGSTCYSEAGLDTAFFHG